MSGSPTRVNEKAGLFVLLTLGAVIVTTIFVNRWQRLSDDGLQIYLDLSNLTDRPVRLREGADVRMASHVIGSVTGIDVVAIQERTPGGGVIDLPALRVKLHISDDFVQYIGADSRAQVRKTFGLVGSHYVEIMPSRMTQAEKRAVGTPTELAVSVVDELSSLDETLTSVNDLLDQLRDEDGPIQQILANAQDMTTRLAKEPGAIGHMMLDPEVHGKLQAILEDLYAGDGLIPRLVSDKVMADDIHSTLSEFKLSLVEINRTLVTVNQSTESIPAMMEIVAAEMSDLSGLVIQTQVLMSEITELVEGMQRHWLLRSAFDDEEPVEWLSPGEVGMP